MPEIDSIQMIRINPDRIISLAQNLVRISSFTFHETDIAYFIYSYLSGAGFDTTLQVVPLPGGELSHQAIARWKGSKPGTKGILGGHIDILDVYRQDKWTFDPFSGSVVDGWLLGQGSLNMKAGLASIIGAVEALRDGGFEPRGEIVIAAVMGEIVGGVGMRHLLSSEHGFDYGLVAEPTNLTVANISVGTGQGVIRLWGDTLYFNPHPNAINGMAKLIEALGPAYGPQQPGAWMTFEPCSDLPGFPRFNVRKISSGQDFCEIFFDSRIVPGQTNASLAADLKAVVERIERLVPGLKGEVLVPKDADTTNFPAMPATPENHPLVKAVASAHQRVTGQQPLIGAGDRIGLASDSSHMKAAGIPAIDYGPGKHPRWPMVDERIKVDDVITSSRTIMEALMEMHR